ncbi:MAG: hypothetical protein SWQ30_06590 [Thermodesulfobacteriota bacterium]|nr:hypothetical protein [Thermodesulfobacteriota bacterium]
MPSKRLRSRARKAPRMQTGDYWTVLIGPKGKVTAKEKKRLGEVWAYHRCTIVEDLAYPYGYPNPGQRPWAFWQYDTPEPRDASVSEHEQLFRMGLLSDLEIQALKAQRQRDLDHVATVKAVPGYNGAFVREIIDLSYLDIGKGQSDD